MIRGISAFVLAVAAAGPATAGDKPKLFGGNKAPLIYPAFESRYIKQFAGPTVSCGACFGYYRTQWRSWADACGEPQPAQPEPKPYAPPPGTVIPESEPEKKGSGALPKIETGPPKPVEKKQPPKTDPPKIELPNLDPPKKDVPKEKTALLPAAPAGFEIAVPTVPLPAPKPVEPAAPIPTVIVPITVK